MPHEHHPQGRDGVDWAKRGSRLELEGEIGLPLLREAIETIASHVGSPDDVRVVLDLGSGPGVATVALAERFPNAAVTAVDASGQLLDLARERAARFGVEQRVTTHVGDLEQQLDATADAGSVDLIWASMVLHHLENLPRVLTRTRGLLDRAGLIAILEFGSGNGPLPSGFDAGRDGFTERLAAARRAALEEHLPQGALSLDWPTLLDEAGFDVLERRGLTLRLPAPLDDAPRRLVHQQLAGSTRMAGGRLDDDDLELLSALVDVDDARCVLHRNDLGFDLSRTFLLARPR